MCDGDVRETERDVAAQRAVLLHERGTWLCFRMEGRRQGERLPSCHRNLQL